MYELSFTQFLRLAKQVAAETGESPAAVFGPIGLYLEDPPKRRDYHCTPVNAATFASTGGDGVHFSFLLDEGSAVRPVVMTVPMNDENNLILAENFSDFLRLGYHRGFFAMEGLLYDRENAIEEYLSPDSEQLEEEVFLLESIRREFQLQPPTRALFECSSDLQSRYTLVLPDFDEWSARNGV